STSHRVARIVEATVEPTMLFDRPCNGRLHVSLSRHDHMDVVGAGTKLFHKPLSAVVLDVRDHDRGSLFDEQSRGRFANTTRSSRDQRDFPAESIHVATLPSWLRIVTTPVANPRALAPPPPGRLTWPKASTTSSWDRRGLAMTTSRMARSRSAFIASPPRRPRPVSARS